MAKKGMSWNEAILKVLKENRRRMKYTEISELIDNAGYCADKKGTTPHHITVNCYLRSEYFKDKVKVLGDGWYVLKEYADHDTSLSTAPTEQEGNTDADTMENSLITAYGRFWDRDLWIQNKMDLYGNKFSQTKPKRIQGARCFSDDSGIYLLHKGYQVVYVGQATVLKDRLADHTTDPLRNRWDSFSWFSLTENESHMQEDSSKTLRIPKLLDTLEALLIETLGPERNSRAGNGFDKEYEQIASSDYLSSTRK